MLKAVLKILSKMPWRLAYALADVLGFLACHVVRYRRKVMEGNLQACFPEMASDERKSLIRRFYRNFADSVLETIKTQGMTDAEMRERMVFEGFDAIDRLMREGRSVAAYFSHTFNWEWAVSAPLWSAFKPYQSGSAPQIGEAAFVQIYRPLRNKAFDAAMLSMRSTFGALSVAKATSLRHFLQLRRDGVATVAGFMSDQKPSHGDPAYATMFLGRPTAMITGTETLARRLGMAAVYWDMEKTSRGHYKITVRMMAEDASATEPMEITRAYARMLQQSIERDPALWLWSHNRWKIPVTQNIADK